MMEQYRSIVEDSPRIFIFLSRQIAAVPALLASAVSPRLCSRCVAVDWRKRFLCARPGTDNTQAFAKESGESRWFLDSYHIRDSPDFNLMVVWASVQLLEVELPGKLETARRVSGCNRPEGGITKVRVGFEEVRMIKGIEQLESELNAHAFRDLPPFLNAGVEVYKSRRAKVRQEPGRIAEGERRRLRESRRVDPVVDRLILRNRIHARHDIWTLIKTETRRVV